MGQLYGPKEGFVHNPILKYRNKTCICGSGVKVKNCCGKNTTVTAEWGRWASEVVAHRFGNGKPPTPYDIEKDPLMKERLKNE